MQGDLLPLSILMKLLGALALCFGLLLGAAWVVKRYWGGFRGAGVGGTDDRRLQLLEAQAMGAGRTLQLLRVDGSDLLLLLGKDQGTLLWSGPAAFDGSAHTVASALRRARKAPSRGPRAEGQALSPDRDAALRLQRARQRRYRLRRRAEKGQAVPFALASGQRP